MPKILFSPLTATSLLITLREALEAALIIAIMAAYLDKQGQHKLKGKVYAGALAALALSLLAGSALYALYGGLGEVASETFEGVASLVAAGVLARMILWMGSHSRSIKAHLEGRVQEALDSQELSWIQSLAFVAVAREGLETVLFLAPGFTREPLPVGLGVVVGVAAVSLLSLGLMRGSARLSLSTFFQVTGVALLLFGAGLAGYGVHELLEAGEGIGLEFGVLGWKPFDVNPPVNPDGSYPLFHEKGAVGQLLAALLGYDGDPELARILAYLGYWAALTLATRSRGGVNHK